MRIQLLDILASPVDAGGPLRLAAWKVRRGDGAVEEVEPFAQESARDAADASLDVEEGALVHVKSGRWFAILDGVPHLVRDPLRYGDREAPILGRLGALPDALRARLSPSLQLRLFAPATDDELAQADANALDEDRYWGGFFKLHWDAGDRSIFDMEAKATHPTMWPMGVREPDARDLERRWGVWPNHVGDWLFAPLQRDIREIVVDAPPGETPWGWDAGCGGGQFGLAAARMGLRMVGSDVATDALQCGRLRALEVGASIDYVRAESAHPPYRDGAFTLLMCKDALHHERDPRGVLARWLEKATPDCRALVYEHSGHNAFAARIGALLHRWLSPRALRRYPRDPEISPFFQSESANEDAGRDALKAALREAFPVCETLEEVRLYHDVDALCWYAFGKLRGPARALIAGPLRLADPLLRRLGGANYLAFRGRR